MAYLCGNNGAMAEQTVTPRHVSLTIMSCINNILYMYILVYVSKTEWRAAAPPWEGAALWLDVKSVGRAADMA